MEYRQKLKEVKRLVIKVGTSLLAEDKRKRLSVLKELAGQIKWLRDRKKEVVLVSSGAIGLGLNELGLKRRPRKLPLEQAVAAVGQSLLMEAYHSLFRDMGITVAQILLTQDDFRNRQRYLNATNTLHTLLELDVLPVINENDTVAVDELHYGNKFGDNDILAALVTNLLRADILIILTDVEGLYKKPDGGEVIDIVEKITPEIEEIALGTKRDTSRGGMSSKLKAATVVTSGGGMTIIASGFRKGVLADIVRGEKIGTLFTPPLRRISHRKLWLAFSYTPSGEIVVDDGAAVALLERGKSLLPIGIKKVEGAFKRGDLVRVIDRRGREIARGLVNFSSGEVENIKGFRSCEIQSILGSSPYEEVIHRDNMVIVI